MLNKLIPNEIITTIAAGTNTQHMSGGNNWHKIN
jgi:hypothetical protein